MNARFNYTNSWTPLTATLEFCYSIYERHNNLHVHVIKKPQNYVVICESTLLALYIK